MTDTLVRPTIVCREMLSTAGADGEHLIFDRLTYYHTGEHGAKVIGNVYPVPGGWQAETSGPRSMAFALRRSRLRAAQDVLDHVNGTCSCTPSGWVCCHGPIPAEVAAAIAEAP